MIADTPDFPLVKSTVAPWLSVADGPAALHYYMTAFGAVERYRLEDRSGRVVVAQLSIGEAEFWIQENLEQRPDPYHGQIHMVLTVDDLEALFRRALAAGGTEIAPLCCGHGWRSGRLADPFGHHWEVGAPLASTAG
jgi:PhnB protein